MNLHAIVTDSNLMSLKDYGAYDFPLRLYLDDFAKLPMGHINWHWHKQIEFSYVLNGELNYRVGETTAHLKQGEAIFVNSERLHTFKLAGGNGKALALSVVFNPTILSCGVESAVYQKYISPIILDKHFPCLPLKRNIPWQSDMLDGLSKLIHLYNEHPYGYELMAQALLVQVWSAMVINLNRKAPDADSYADLINEERLKRMISFIQSRYHERVSLGEIAASASVSKSECIRCFKSRLNTTPIEYLIEFRVSRAILLLEKNELPIADIGQRCGFESASYFTKVFKRKTGFTPSNYGKPYVFDC